mgnify:CR=1 FL=1
METIIPPVDRALIEKELNEDRLIRDTNNANNKIYVITHHDSPNTMREIPALAMSLKQLQQGLWVT